MDNPSDQAGQTSQITPAETPAPSEPTVSQPQSSPSSMAPKKSSKKMMVMMLAVLLAVVLVAAAGFAGYKASASKGDKKAAELNSKIALLESNEHSVPSTAIKVSECVPNMGAHYMATKDADPEYGPFLLVTKSNKVIGVEYMASSDMYTKIPNTDPPVEVITKNSPMYGWKFDHAEVSHLPKGHEGLLEDHIDIHLYTVNSDQQKQACI
ncbi:MAG: hypothetical protein JWO47_757 [Candidatus Saccharibacteria bacterium]|nr:hypothetical protein [Candidatus Saccharibacteria bacterium]